MENEKGRKPSHRVAKGQIRQMRRVEGEKHESRMTENEEEDVRGSMRPFLIIL
jgi:hypothetical protein